MRVALVCLISVTFLYTASSIATSAEGSSVGPCRAVGIRTDLQRAVDRSPAGTTFCIGPGIHRLRTFIVPKTGDTFVGSAGAALDGAVELKGFRHTGDWWTARLAVPLNPVHAGTCAAAGATACQYANDVFLGDRPLRRVEDLALASPKNFYVSTDGQTLYLGQDPGPRSVEIAVATRAFKGWLTGVDSVTIKGLTIEKFANEAGIGAINGRPNWRVIDNTVKLNHGIGIQDAGFVEGNRVVNNGQLGVSGSFVIGSRVVHNLIEGNNYAGFDSGDEAGGGKWVKAQNLTVAHNVVRYNHGPGLWTDGDSTGVVYANNVIRGNSGPGILHEISYRALIEGNTVVGNGLGTTTGWVDGAGILLNSSGDVEIAHNLVSRNRDGIGIAQTDRGSGAYGPHVTHNDYVHENTVTMLRGYTGLVTSTEGSAYFTSNENHFAHNRYFVGCGRRHFAWLGSQGRGDYITWKQWQAAGNDLGATMTSICR